MKIILVLALAAVYVTAEINAMKGNSNLEAADLLISTTNVEIVPIQRRAVKAIKGGKIMSSTKATVSKAPKTKTGSKSSLKMTPSKKQHGSKAKGNAAAKSTKYPQIAHGVKSKAYSSIGKTVSATTKTTVSKDFTTRSKSSLTTGHGPWNKGKASKSTKYPQIALGVKSKAYSNLWSTTKAPKSKASSKWTLKSGRAKKKHSKGKASVPTKNPQNNKGPGGGQTVYPTMVPTEQPSNRPSTFPTMMPTGKGKYGPGTNGKSKASAKWTLQSGPAKKNHSKPTNYPQNNKGPGSNGGGQTEKPSNRPSTIYSTMTPTGKGNYGPETNGKGKAMTSKYPKSPGASAKTSFRAYMHLATDPATSYNAKETKTKMASGVLVSTDSQAPGTDAGN